MGVSAPAPPPRPSTTQSVVWSVAVIVAAVVGFALGRISSHPATMRQAAAAVATNPAPVAAESERTPTAKSVESQSYEVPSAPEPTEPPPSPPPPTALVAEVNARPTPVAPYLVIEDFLVREPDSIGAVWFDGEVRNLGPGSARVRIVAKAYSINEVLLDSKEFHVSTSPIPPGEAVHFNSYVRSNRGEEIRKVVPQVIAY